MTKGQLYQAKITETLQKAADLEAALRELAELEPVEIYKIEVKRLYTCLTLTTDAIDQLYHPL